MEVLDAALTTLADNGYLSGHPQGIMESYWLKLHAAWPANRASYTRYKKLG